MSISSYSPLFSFSGFRDLNLRHTYRRFTGWTLLGPGSAMLVVNACCASLYEYPPSAVTAQTDNSTNIGVLEWDVANGFLE